MNLIAALSLLWIAGTAQSIPPTDRELRVSVYSAYRGGILPWKTNNPYIAAMQSCVNGRLVKLDEAGKLSGDLAKAWTISRDGRTYTFHMNDGERGLGKYAELSLKESTSDRSKALHRDLLISLFKNQKDSKWASVDKAGDLVVRLDRPYSPLPYLLTSPEFSVVPKDAIEDKSLASTGDYSFQQTDIAGEVKLERKIPDSTHFQKIKVAYTQDVAQLRARALKGEMDLLIGATPKVLDEVMAGTKLQLVKGYVSSPMQFIFNRKSEIFENEKFRRDLFSVLQPLAQEWSKSNKFYAYHPHILSPGIMPPDYYAEHATRKISDEEFRKKWKDLIDQQGLRFWINGDYYPNGFIDVVAAKMKSLSQKVEISTTNFFVFQDTQQKGKYFDIVFGDGGYLFPDPDSGVALWDFGQTPNFEFPGKPLFDTLEKYRFLKDPKKRLTKYTEEIRKFEEMHWVVPLFDYYDRMAKVDSVELPDSRFGLYDVVCGAKPKSK